jgi:hypothetical protein
MSRIAILSTVTPGRERYCPLLLDHVDKLWPDHPPMFFSLPAGRTAATDRVIASNASTWTGTLLFGLKQLKASGCDYVFMLLEDHVPLQRCDVAVIERVFTIMQAEQLPCVFFTKYEWPWTSTRHWFDETGRLVGWPKIDVVTFGGHTMARVPKNFFRYNQCQPAIWNLDYYISLVETAIAEGAHDPWQFEEWTRPDQPQHYVSSYKWPSWSNGYLDKGHVDWKAVRMMQMPESQALRDALLHEYFPNVALPTGMLFALGESVYLATRLKTVPGRLARRLGRLFPSGKSADHSQTQLH